MADDKKKKANATVSEIVDKVAKLSVLELSELVDALQDKLGVEAAAPVAVAAPAAGGDASAEETSGGVKTVVITAAGDNKIAVIKAIRVIDQNVSLQDAKGMTESLPAEVLKEAKADEAKEAADKLKEAGATVELK